MFVRFDLTNGGALALKLEFLGPTAVTDPMAAERVLQGIEALLRSKGLEIRKMGFLSKDQYDHIQKNAPPNDGLRYGP